jgi:quinol monooxygenase YgiN
MTRPLTIIAVTKAVAGQEGALRAAQQRLVAETVNEPGCIRYELNQSLDDPRMLIFTESWATESLWRAHMEGDAMRRFQNSGASRLIEEFALFRLGLVANDGAS